jgi:hypothetical protein
MAVNVGSGEIVASMLIDNTPDSVDQMPAVLEELVGPTGTYPAAPERA